MEDIKAACKSLTIIKKEVESIEQSLKLVRSFGVVPKECNVNRFEYLHAARHHPAAFYFRNQSNAPKDPGPLSGLSMEERNAIRDIGNLRQKLFYEEFRVKELGKIVAQLVPEKGEELKKRLDLETQDSDPAEVPEEITSDNTMRLRSGRIVTKKT